MKSLLTILVLLAFACNSEKRNDTKSKDNIDTQSRAASPSQAPPQSVTQSQSALNGSWELDLISPIGGGDNFTDLYPGKTPFLKINADSLVVSGGTGCNNFSGKITIDKRHISFNQPLAMTQMMCPGNGEKVFVETLQKVSSWAITDDSTLHLIMGDVALMRFKRRM